MNRPLQQKRSKTEMENLRRKRLNNEFQKTRDIVDARRPNLNCKMEQGDILEQMRDLFLTTEQQLKEREAQLAQFQQNFGESFE
jgi:predicted secreted acid phosphatase